MSVNTDTLSERIGTLAEDADQLLTEIKKLRREVNKREGIEAKEYLADVPGELDRAEALADQMYEALESAETAAKKGGE